MTQKWTPDGDVSNSGFTDNGGGSSNLYTKIDEDTVGGSTDSTYIQATDDDSSSNKNVILTLEDESTPDSGDCKFYFRAKSTNNYGFMGGSALTIKIHLLEGSSNTSRDTYQTALSTSFTNYESDVLDVSGVSDWSELRVKIEVLTGGGMGDTATVSNLYLQTPAAGSSSAKIPVTLFINGMST